VSSGESAVAPEQSATEALAAVFGRAAPTYDSVIPFFATFGRRLVDLAAPAPGERVLDVACGRGASLFPAAERVGSGGEVVGVDLAPEMTSALRADIAERGVANARVELMDAQCLSLQDSSFDVVLCGFSLWLLPRPHAAASEFRRVLRPGGRCAVSMPVGAGKGWDFVVPLMASFASRAALPMPPPPRLDVDLAAVLGNAGFEVAEVLDHVADFLLPDAEAWWRWVWSAGLRAYLETLAEDALAELRAAAFAHLATCTGPDGIPLAQRARFVLATAPA